MRNLIRDYPWLLTAKFYFTQTLLHLVCWDDQAAMASLLLELGADVNAPGPDGMTPLRWCIRSAGLETVQVLIRYKANLDMGAPLYWGAVLSKSKIEVIVALVKAGARNRGDEVFHQAVRKGNEKLVDLFIEHLFSVNSRGYDGHSLLSWAVCCYKGVCHDRIVQKLLSHDADVNARSKYNQTALSKAISEKSTLHLAALFLDHGAHMVPEDNFRHSSLYTVAHSCELACIHFLIERADVQTIKVHGENFLRTLLDRQQNQQVREADLLKIVKNLLVKGLHLSRMVYLDTRHPKIHLQLKNAHKIRLVSLGMAQLSRSGHSFFSTADHTLLKSIARLTVQPAEMDEDTQNRIFEVNFGRP